MLRDSNSKLTAVILTLAVAGLALFGWAIFNGVKNALPDKPVNVDTLYKQLSK